MAQSPNRLVVRAAQASPRTGSTQRNVPLPPKWPNSRDEVSEPGPVALLRSLQLDAEPPVERAEAAELGQHAVEARELDRDHLVMRLGSDEPWSEQLTPDCEHVLEARMHAAARMP